MPRPTAAGRADTALAVAVSVPAVAVIVWTVLAGQPQPWPIVAMLGAAAAAMFARRTRPVPAALVTSVAYVIAVQSGSFNLHSSSPGTIAGTIGTGIAVPALCYTLGSSVRLPGSLAGLAVLSASLQWGELNPFPAMLTVGMWLVGRAVRSHRLLSANLRIRAFELESEREQFAAETVRYERDRIARELHDVIAHSVSIMVIQASAGQRLKPGDPAAGELLGIIAELVREATTDIGGLTYLLNPTLEHPLTQEHLEDLLARTAQTGVQLDFDIVGDVSSIPGHAARATYRILQEGLTNAIRHAPGAAIHVSVACGNGIRLEIVNDMPPAGAVGIGELGSGHGLAGLAERAAALGGTIHSGPVPVGGWRLSAELPATT
ncbi:MAG: histidine kinase [Streptosporangiaceae bacterium]|jgi:signal transduction histidine kinase